MMVRVNPNLAYDDVDEDVAGLFAEEDPEVRQAVEDDTATTSKG